MNTNLEKVLSFAVFEAKTNKLNKYLNDIRTSSPNFINLNRIPLKKHQSLRQILNEAGNYDVYAEHRAANMQKLLKEKPLKEIDELLHNYMDVRNTSSLQSFLLHYLIIGRTSISDKLRRELSF